ILASESCAEGRKVLGEAWTGEHAGQPSSSESITPVCQLSPDQGKATRGATPTQAAPRHRGVSDPGPAGTLPTREPGDPRNALVRRRRGTAGEGLRAARPARTFP